MDVIYIFIAQFSFVYVLGIQSLNVRDGHYLGAAASSLLIGVSGFTVTSTIGGLNLADIGSPVGLSFLLAGPMAITAAMRSHNWLVRLFRRST